MFKMMRILVLSFMYLIIAGWNRASEGNIIATRCSTTVLPVAQAAAEVYMGIHP